MTPPIPEGSSANSPLAPSVEKAYYRKCIQLKRRLNELEAANDELKIRRIRLDRSIMKMRLERAFLLEQLAKRVDIDPDGSEGSGDEQVNTPPPDRPHRDKKRKLPGESGTLSSAARPSDVATRDTPPASPTDLLRGPDRKRPSLVETDTHDVNGSMDVDRGADVDGEAVASGSAVYEDANGQLRVAPGGISGLS